MLFFTKPMCVFCKRRTRENHFALKGAAVCGACFDALPITSEDLSFQPFGRGCEFSYLISPFFYDGAFRRSVLEYKFRGARAYAGIFTELIKERVDAEHLRTFDMIVPVPLSKRRMTERGYNQSALIAKPLAEFLDLEYSETVLTRVINTKRQSSLNKLQRRENVKNAFRASGAEGKKIIVFDDIYTTGFTLNECAAALKRGGAAEVIGLTLSIAPRGLLLSEDYIEKIF